MIFSALLLFVGALAGGLTLYIIPSIKRNLRLPLIFAGSYLFAITVIHIIPELFFLSSEPSKIGLFILVGFFLQQILEYFSSGVEHGHFHAHRAVSVQGRFSIVIALFIHSLLEGTLLIHDSPFHKEHESYSLLIGIVLHKMPAAFALMVTMQPLGRRAIYILILFSIASPLGLYLADYLAISSKSFIVLFAIVSGSFLYISTTIFVESSPEHQFGLTKIVFGLLGALLAIFVEFII